MHRTRLALAATGGVLTALAAAPALAASGPSYQPTVSTSALGTATTQPPSTVAPTTTSSAGVAVLGTQDVNGDGSAAGTSGASLPFTGADVAGLTAAGLALVGGGAAFVIAGRRRGAHR